MSFRHATFEHTGTPEGVVRVVDAKSQPLTADSVRIGMQFAPINPADINYLQGTYGKKATLPATPGMEGTGTVLEIGSDVRSFAEGDQVILHNHIGCWSQELTVPQTQVVRLAAAIDPHQAAMLRVNPTTAWRLLTGYHKLQTGDWIVQNAANSGVGLAVIQLAKQLGVNTLNLVRRNSALEICHAVGAEHVLLDKKGLQSPSQLETEPPLAFNAVGGDSALRLMSLLAPKGTHITYGAMSRQPLKVPNKFLIFKEIQLRGLWVSRWLNDMCSQDRQDLFDHLGEAVRNGHLQLPIDTVYPLDQIARAVFHAQTPQRCGKVMIDLRS